MSIADDFAILFALYARFYPYGFLCTAYAGHQAFSLAVADRVNVQ